MARFSFVTVMLLSVSTILLFGSMTSASSVVKRTPAPAASANTAITAAPTAAKNADIVERLGGFVRPTSAVLLERGYDNDTDDTYDWIMDMNDDYNHEHDDTCPADCDSKHRPKPSKPTPSTCPTREPRPTKSRSRSRPCWQHSRTRTHSHRRPTSSRRVKGISYYGAGWKRQPGSKHTARSIPSHTARPRVRL